MSSNNLQNELTAIRSLMERSTKFLSLSGLSGVLAGIYALIGGGMAYSMLNTGAEEVTTETVQNITYLAAVVLIASIATGVVLTYRQANKNGESFWNPVSKRMITSMLVPLLTGGILILIMLMQGYFQMIAASCLIFYGLSLFAAGEFSFSAVKWLGLLEIILGLIAAFMPAYGLIIWMIGFGGLHIIYGSWMHINYNK